MNVDRLAAQLRDTLREAEAATLRGERHAAVLKGHGLRIALQLEGEARDLPVEVSRLVSRQLLLEVQHNVRS